MGVAQDIDEIMHMSLRVNDFLSGLFLAIGIKLVDFKLEFGRWWNNEEVRVVLADEISPDNCRLWDVSTNEIMDKDGSAAIWAASRKPTRKSPGGSAFFRKAERPLTWTARR